MSKKPVTIIPGLEWYFDEEQPVRDAWWHPGSGDVVIDVGSMMGNYSIPALAAGAQVIAVDPAVALTAQLQQIAAANGLSDRLTISNTALFDGGDYTAIRDGVSASPYAHLLPPPGTRFTTLDELAESNHLDRMDWVKIDVEGAEYGVLRGGEKSLRRWHPHILIEDHTLVYQFVRDMNSTRLCKQFLTGLGYKVHQEPFDEQRTFLVAA